jgi:hypothetical protein
LRHDFVLENDKIKDGIIPDILRQTPARIYNTFSLRSENLFHLKKLFANEGIFP